MHIERDHPAGELVGEGVRHGIFETKDQRGAFGFLEQELDGVKRDLVEDAGLGGGRWWDGDEDEGGGVQCCG